MEEIFQNSYFYFFLVMLVYGIGDVLGVLTKAKVSSVFVVMLTFLILFMTDVFPADIIDQAGLSSMADMAVGMLIFHMGTTINLKQLISEWRTVVTALISMVVVALAVFVLIPFIGYENAIVTIPVLNGGIISTQIMSEAASNANLAVPAALAAILYAVKKFAGSYPASMFGVKEANNILEKYRSNPEDPMFSMISNETEKDNKGFAIQKQKYFTDFVCIMVATFFSWVAVTLETLIPQVNMSIWALVLGAIMGYYNLVPARILDKGKSSGIISMLTYAVIIPSLANIDFAQLSSLAFQIIVILAVTIIALIICFYILPGYKIIGSKPLATGVSLAQYLGFPATYLISKEVAKAVTEDPDEQEIVLNRIMPSYVVGSMTTVTVFSIVIAGIMVNFI
ncbi:hypothetical protein WN873_10025 [Tetragenococcus halophilus]|uniref:hypothetical protein n=1 Tax=Tetragenococcus halophilus TaxID=51669 RepID=UPI0030EFF59D